MFKIGDQINTSVDGVAVSGTVTECDLGMVNFTLNAPAYNFCVDEASCTAAVVIDVARTNAAVAPKVAPKEAP
jgi:hypothetical protein